MSGWWLNLSHLQERERSGLVFPNSWYAANDVTWKLADIGNQSLPSEVDICVIGAGFTGLNAALHLAQHGVKVIVLEAARVGHGASGRNGGQVVHGYACSLQTLAKELGYINAQDCWNITLEGIQRIKQNIRQFDIDCAYKPGYVFAATNPQQTRKLREFRKEICDVWGHDITQTSFLDMAELKSVVNSPLYDAGLVDMSCGHLNPLKYVRGLAEICKKNSVDIYEETLVSNVDQSKSSFLILKTNRSEEIRCKNVILACNVDVYSVDLNLSNYFIPIWSHILATRPLTDDEITSTLPKDYAVGDSNAVLDYYRLSEDKRLLFGGRTVVPFSSDPKRERSARLEQVFPQLKGVKIDYSWGGFIDFGLTHTPQFGHINNRIFYAQGFAGHGLVLSGMSGVLIGDRILGKNTRRFDMFTRLKQFRLPSSKIFRIIAPWIGIWGYKMMDILTGFKS